MFSLWLPELLYFLLELNGLLAPSRLNGEKKKHGHCNVIHETMRTNMFL